MKLHTRIVMSIIALIIALGICSLPYTSIASTSGQGIKDHVSPRPTHENDHLYFEYVGSVTKLVPVIIVNSPPKGFAEGKAGFTAIFSYSFRSDAAEVQKVSTESLIFDIKAKDGGVAGAFVEVVFDIYNVYVCNYVNPDGCEYRDTIARVGKILGYVPIVVVRKSTDQTFIPVQVFKDGIPSVKFDVRYKNTSNNKFVDTRKYNYNYSITVKSTTLMTISTGFYYGGEYLHGSLKVTYGKSVEKKITYIFPPGCIWRVHPLGSSITSAWSFKLLECTGTG